jgi:hypothetical protein
MGPRPGAGTTGVMARRRAIGEPVRIEGNDWDGVRPVSGRICSLLNSFVIVREHRCLAWGEPERGRLVQRTVAEVRWI